MPSRSRCSVNRMEVYCDPASELNGFPFNSDPRNHDVEPADIPTDAVSDRPAERLTPECVMGDDQAATHQASFLADTPSSAAAVPWSTAR